MYIKVEKHCALRIYHHCYVSEELLDIQGHIRSKYVTERFGNHGYSINAY